MAQSVITFGEQKKEIEFSLAKILVTQVDAGKIDYHKSQDIAGFILEKLDAAKSSQDLLNLLQEVSSKWPEFETTYQLFRLKMMDTQETLRKLQEAKAQLQSMSTQAKT